MEVYFEINGKDAYSQWGAFMGEGSLTALMTPPSNKAYLESESALEHGKRMLADGARLAARDLSVTLYLTAPTFAEFIRRYQGLCSELATGRADIRTRFQPDTVYRCLYMGCQQFQQWDGRLAMFALKLCEPNPAHRAPGEYGESGQEPSGY